MTRDEIEKELCVFQIPKGFIEIGAAAQNAMITFAEHILRVAEQKRWRPIETAPKDGTIFTGYQYGRNGQLSSFKARWREDWNDFQAMHVQVDCVCYPSHWLPLNDVIVADDLWQNQYHEQPVVPEVKS